MSAPAYVGYSLDGPATREAMHRRRVEARARMAAGAKTVRQDAAPRRLPAVEAGLPGFATRAAGGGPYAPADVLRAVTEDLRSIPGGDAAFLRQASAYWLLGLTNLTPADVARLLGLGAARAADAMRAYAAAGGLPPIDMTGDAT